MEAVSAELEVTAYRSAVSDLLADLGARPGITDPVLAESVVSRRITEPEFAQLLAATPKGLDGSASQILAEIREFRPNSTGSAGTLSELVRICLLAQIDAVWWGAVSPYHSDRDVTESADLVDLDEAVVGFRFRRQTDVLARRMARAVERRVAPGRIPDPVGLRFARTRPEVATLLNELSAEFARFAPSDTPPLWVTSLARSVQHQLRLRALGYSALLPSSHCTGYGVDIVMSWYRRYSAAGVLHQLLLERCEAGQINVISGGQTWHVCLSPRGTEELSLSGGTTPRTPRASAAKIQRRIGG